MSATSAAVQGRRRAPRHAPKLWRVPVTAVRSVTPRMVRVTVGSETLADFPGGGGDQHVVLYFYESPADLASLPQPLTLESARASFARVRPQMRSYTVRRHDPTRHEIDLDFVLHGDAGPAARWADRAHVGDEVILVGPSPVYQPDPNQQTHLLVGDETALPAIGAMLAELPASTRAFVVIEVADSDEEQALLSAAAVDIHWLHRNGAPAGRPDALTDVVEALGELPPDVTVWAAGERTAMHHLRGYLLDERGLDRRRVRSTVYWRLGQPGS